MKYRGKKTRLISFPLGGLGSGSIGLSGSGRLVDWEVANRPNKCSYQGTSHFAIRAEKGKRVVDARILHSDFPPPYTGSPKQAKFYGFGHGASTDQLGGGPHFRDLVFDGKFPFARLSYIEPDFPGSVELLAFNPFIPGNADDSSIPAAFFRFEVTNSTPDTLTYTIAGSVWNPGELARHVATPEGVALLQGRHPADSPGYGEFALAAAGGELCRQLYWYRGRWKDSVTSYWNDFTSPGPLPPRDYADPREAAGDSATLGVRFTLKPGEKQAIPFVIAWYSPNVENFWNPAKEAEYQHGWKNYYARLFGSAAEAAAYSIQNFERLEAETRRFQEALFASTLPAEVLDAVSANISILKSATCLRLEDGEFYGFEGCHEQIGSCEGSCTHVWNYAYALPFLFPELERSMRRLNFRYSFREDGGLSFRLQLPLGRKPAGRSCADGQFGDVVKCYREWTISGSRAFLEEMWPGVKKAIEYAWSPANRDRWDPEGTGVLTGRQHHTLDMELFGPNSWLTGFYHAALEAGARMAEAMGETEFAARCRDLRKRGAKIMEKELYNGEYYIQKVNLTDKSQLDGHDAAVANYWNEETGELKYQLANGCAIDQVLAQYHADLCGLGDLYNPERLESALRSIYKYNFLPSMRKLTNFWRLYAINDEAGTLICSWPKGDSPKIPLPYASETMHGFEYQFACQLIRRGMVKEGLEVVRSIRDRYDGEVRNPWNEMECGSNYARSMASYALLNVFSGFQFDQVEKGIAFDPVEKGKAFTCFWALEGAYGLVRVKENSLTIEVRSGELELTRVGKICGVKEVQADGKKVAFKQNGDEVLFDVIKIKEKLVIKK